MSNDLQNDLTFSLTEKASLPDGTPLIAEIRRERPFEFDVQALLPLGGSKNKDTRHLDIHQDDPLHEELVASWIRQASELPGWTLGQTFNPA